MAKSANGRQNGGFWLPADLLSKLNLKNPLGFKKKMPKNFPIDPPRDREPWWTWLIVMTFFMFNNQVIELFKEMIYQSFNCSLISNIQSLNLPGIFESVLKREKTFRNAVKNSVKCLANKKCQKIWPKESEIICRIFLAINTSPYVSQSVLQLWVKTPEKCHPPDKWQQF